MKKVTLLDLQAKKQRGEKITMLTAYDYPFAHLMDEVGIDTILVGDSLGMVVLGYESTLPVTMEEMLHHVKAVKRGVNRAFLIGDLPFMSYQASEEEAVRNAGAFMKAGCDAVKLEGGKKVVPKIKAIVNAGIPVLGHIGLTPQSISKLGGYRVQGRDIKSARRIIEDALALEAAGVFGIVLECIPYQLAKLITERLSIPTIGIGAGPYCDGQVLVIHDILGIFEKFTPRFVKVYANLATQIKTAIKDYKKEVETGEFPSLNHSYELPEETWENLLQDIEKMK
ncbi:MAG: 3-methyl-2-oxobutanoate hydroxymethyltransferase [Candidatus Desulfofervidaceae bacterium]|nr:3-methyl-2-oxobutanoate hydroxymethyltransferase [Candidatus Desulfofervidaceae bacterium]